MITAYIRCAGAELPKIHESAVMSSQGLYAAPDAAPANTNTATAITT